jgi:hypothetical protein
MKKVPCMSAHLRNADCSPPHASLFFMGKFNYFIILKKRVPCSVFLVTEPAKSTGSQRS